MKLNDKIDTQVLSELILISIKSRAFIIGDLFQVATIIACTIIYYFEFTKDYGKLSICLTYTVLAFNSF